MRTKLALYVLIIMLFPFFLSLSFAMPTKVGKISRLRGSAQIIRKGIPTPISAKLGMELYQLDKVKTAKKAYVMIQLLDGRILTVGEKAELSLDQFIYDPKKKKRNALLRMAIGKLRVFANDLVNYKERGFKVQTPTAIVGVRGTLFLVWVKSKAITKVVCLQKAVQVANIMKPTEFIVLTQNLATDIIHGKPPAKPVLVTPEQLKDLQVTLNSIDADVIILGTPTDISRLIKLNKPVVKVKYELKVVEGPSIKELIDEFLEKVKNKLPM